MAQAAQDLSTREVRAKLADVINDAAAYGTVTFITSRGRRIAAVVPVAVGEAAIEPADPSDS
ncbi:type II toxin-antitoxin system prevent-host-death family antitoxin [Nonomuraea guangzhouensis]|uniref:Type II toxin-antitoxin system prevent-host-death family antitoxin n=1 Tax=Nonomuraea guangzhouensis TaxID=1291555 RepID=A0ABW4GX69_9ACTN|nr:type II toxin-antitoxin system prevent-host-death family antitoxin [Nonomuraea guangzhouensis]